ncbi:hypothetical protein [Peribacillus frigoritolerans]|uniref:hypothetical protein n=1 Tax=Peribacillus castrilensis TaxID=2897690 RepID=UPI002DC69A94|nr:hypothetical protein [Peribacillus castrilensis]
MQKAVIYYQLEQNRELDEEVKQIESIIKKIDAEILGVFVDLYDSNDELINMTTNDLSVISYLYVNKPFVDEFNQKLLQELSRQEQFDIKYFDDI